MKYVVIKGFSDLTDDRYHYGPGDEFPRGGLRVSEERIRELSSSENRQGVPLIRKAGTRRKREQ